MQRLIGRSEEGNPSSIPLIPIAVSRSDFREETVKKIAAIMSKPALPKLPKEAVRFAKSMGLDLDGLEPEAEDIWKMLDEMSTSDPLRYEEFVGQQLRSTKEDEKATDAGVEKRSFRPSGIV